MKYRFLLSIFTLMLTVSFSLMFLKHFIEIDSNYDLLFEGNTFVILAYVYIVARKTILSNTALKFGVWVLLFNKIYDVLTEIEVLDQLADQYEFVDTLLEDGFQQIAFMLIAVGLTQMLKAVKDQAYRDELTGLYNRKQLNEIDRDEFDLIYIDLDGLKALNDTRGHDAGDNAIKGFADSIKSFLKDNDQALRIGGDEFIVLTKSGTGHTFILELKSQTKDIIRFSYGVETTTIDEYREAIARSDQAMYEMKQKQRELAA